MRLHRGNQGGATRHEGDALRQNLADHALGQIAQERHALDQRPLEVKLAVHRPRRDRAHMIAHARHLGQLVNAFLTDHGAVHVGQQHPLGAAFGGLHHQIDARALQLLPDVPAVAGYLGHVELRRLIRRKPAQIAATPGIAQRLGQRGR